jgi:hypothetical protein
VKTDAFLFWSIVVIFMCAHFAHAAQAPTPIVGFVKTQLGNQVTITYTDSTKATIATITYSDGTVVTVTSGTTADTYTRTN